MSVVDLKLVAALNNHIKASERFLSHTEASLRALEAVRKFITTVVTTALYPLQLCQH
jgi:hypothetical protein